MQFSPTSFSANVARAINQTLPLPNWVKIITRRFSIRQRLRDLGVGRSTRITRSKLLSLLATSIDITLQCTLTIIRNASIRTVYEMRFKDAQTNEFRWTDLIRRSRIRSTSNQYQSVSRNVNLNDGKGE